MYNEHHNLVSEFPKHRDLIHTLKETDAHFRRLFDLYHEVDKELHQIESGVVSPSDEYVESCKKRRLKLKDELFEILSAKAA